MDIKITKDYSGIDKVLRRLKDLRAAKVEAGFFPESKYGPENGNLYVATVAFWNEFGKDMQVPPRPFFITTIQEHKKEWAKFIAKNVGSYLFKFPRPISLNVTLNGVGGMMVKDIQNTIEDWSTPPNSARWEAVKGFNDPLIYTRTMINSVKFEIVR